MDPYQSQTTAPRQSVHDVIPAHMEISSPIPPSSATTVCVAVTRRRHATNSLETRLCRLFIDLIFIVAIEFSLQRGTLNSEVCSVVIGVLLVVYALISDELFHLWNALGKQSWQRPFFSDETSTCAKIFGSFPAIFESKESNPRLADFHIKIQNRKRPHKLLTVSFHRKRKSLIKVDT